MTQNPDPHRARETLLQHYTSQIRNHGWYLLTSAVTILTGMQVAAGLAEWNPGFAIWDFSISVSFGVDLLTHSFGRIMYYGRSCDFIIEDRREVSELWRLSEDVRYHIRHGRFSHRVIAILFSGDLHKLLFPLIVFTVVFIVACLIAVNTFN